MNTGLHARVRTLLKNLLLLCAIFLVFGLYSVVIAEQIAEEELKEIPQVVQGTVDQSDILPKDEEETTPPPEKKIPTEKIKTNKSLSQDQQLTKVRQELTERQFPPEIISRIDEFEQSIATPQPEKNILQRFIDRVRGDTPEQKERAYIEKESKKQPFAVVTNNKPIEKRNLDSFESTFKNGVEKKNLKEKIKNLFKKDTLQKAVDGTLSFLGLRKEAVAQASENPNDYLAEEGEIQFSQSVQNLATSLNHDPLKILNYVRNNVEFVPYYGSKKGSDATLIERAGNATDQSALLIALLRNSNIPARYKQADVKIDIRTVTDLLGVTNAIAAAQVLTLSNIPYILYVDQNNEPCFFVIEHTYVEAYMPYGYTRGADSTDGGELQWVPMDPSIKSVYYEQLVDIMGDMKQQSFNVETFFENYLDGDYGTTTPVKAFRTEVINHLTAHPPQSYPNLTYDDALVRKYTSNNNFEFIPSTLPYEVAALLATYQKMPNELRHTLTFTVEDEAQSQTHISHSAYISDLANKEITITYDAASSADQQVIDSFDTIYDVVPLSLVHVLPTIKINGTQIAQATASTTLGQNQHYSLEFKSPTRVIGASITTQTVDTIEKDIIVGSTEGIALDTDRVVPPELRPSQDTQTQSFVNAQKLFKTAQNYLYRLESTQEELSNVIGGDFNDLATRAIVFNGIQVIYQNNQPYSFDWKGLRIDSSAKVSYYNRFSEDTTTHRKEFTYLFGLEASHHEAQIFEDDYDILAIATVKGLKLVSQNTFANTVLLKLTSQNEGVIDTLTDLSATTRSIFHTAVQQGNIIYTPNKPITYGTWTGLLYININPQTGAAGYIIGKGLNGGYSVCALPGTQSLCQWGQNFTDLLIPQAEASSITATIITPTQNFVVTVGDTIHASIQYVANVGGNIFTWIEDTIFTDHSPGLIYINPNYGATGTTSGTVNPPPNPLNIDTTRLINSCGKNLSNLDGNPCARGNISPDLLVIHTTFGNTAASAIDTMESRNLSVHYVVDSDENATTYQLLQLSDFGQHAGPRANNRSIGIEVVNRGWFADDDQGNLRPAEYFVCIGYADLTKSYCSNRYPSQNWLRDKLIQNQWLPNGDIMSGYQIDDGVPLSPQAPRYWDPLFSENQYNSLYKLINKITASTTVNKILFLPDHTNYISDDQIFRDGQGILGHSVITNYKWDPGPLFNWTKAVFGN